MAELGEQVALLLDADGVGGIYSTAETSPVVDEDTDYVRYSDGTVTSYDRAAKAMTVDCVGQMVLKCSAGVTIEAGEAVLIKAAEGTLDIPQLTHNGQLSLAGNLGAEGNITATGSVMDTSGSSNHHSY